MKTEEFQHFLDSAAIELDLGLMTSAYNCVAVVFCAMQFSNFSCYVKFSVQLAHYRGQPDHECRKVG